MVETISFLDYHKPVLADGTYTVTVTQTLKTQKSTKIPVQTFMNSAQFAVQGPHYALDPSEIQTLFPPAGNLGDHANALPHIVFTRSTLPWERDADSREGGLSWLALLLLEEGEQLGGTITRQVFLQTFPDPTGTALWNYLLSTSAGWLQQFSGSDTALISTREMRASQALQAPFTAYTDQVDTLLNTFRGPQTLPLSSLQAATTGPLNWPGWQVLEAGEEASDLVTVIDVSQALLTQILPTVTELPFLAHVRKASSTTDPGVDNELSIVIGKRLPRKGATSTIHLVSLEGRYTNGQFTTQTNQQNAFTRLISLKSWQFACLAAEHQFEGLLTNLNREPGTLRLPHVSDPTVDSALTPGYTLLPHNLRQGEQTASWYHGPFVTSDVTASFELPARSSDALLRYNSTYGIFDTSYAAAWELGRLLALQSKAFSTSLFLWKRTYALQQSQQLQQNTYSYLPLQVQTLLKADEAGIPDTITSWFEGLSLLQGVPFNYLVPDERMLPVESLRFFRVDPQWVSCLLDGAFSIGRATQANHAQDSSYPDDPSKNPYNDVSGFLLRSAVVAGWPTMEIYASDRSDYFTSSSPTGSLLPLLRMERLSTNVLLCLFKGKLQSLAISEKAEGLHFGFDVSTDADQHFYKMLRDSAGHFSGTNVDPIPWQSQTGVLDIVSLAKSLATNCTSATFAYQMVEQASRIIFRSTQ